MTHGSLTELVPTARSTHVGDDDLGLQIFHGDDLLFNSTALCVFQCTTTECFGKEGAEQRQFLEDSPPSEIKKSLMCLFRPTRLCLRSFAQEIRLKQSSSHKPLNSTLSRRCHQRPQRTHPSTMNAGAALKNWATTSVQA